MKLSICFPGFPEGTRVQAWTNKVNYSKDQFLCKQDVTDKSDWINYPEKPTSDTIIREARLSE